MNYYERHLGDYATAAGHLSMLEDGAYTRLLDRYYASERGIPADQVYRVARATTRQEKAAVDAVLREFFRLEDGEWINGRAEEDIARFVAKEPQRQAKKDNQNDRQRRSRDRRKQLFAELVSHGITPDFDATTDELVTLLSRVTCGDVTCDVTATQTPDTRHQNKTTHSLRATGANAGTFIPQDFQPDQQHQVIAKNMGVDLQTQRDKFVDHFTAKGEMCQDWAARFRNWLRDAPKHGDSRYTGNQPRGSPRPSAADQRAQERADTVAGLTGRHRPQQEPSHERTIDADCQRLD